MHRARSSVEEVPYGFWRSSVKFQGHTALKIAEFDPDWAFPDCNSSIAQIAPLSFQGSQKTQTQTSEVRWLHASVVTEWSPACLHKQFPGDLHRGNQRKPQMEDVHNSINIGPTSPIQILNQHEIFWRFCMCNSNDTFAKNKKYWSRYWGSTAKTGSLLVIKQT